MEGELFIQESFNGYLVGRIQYRGRGSAGPQSAIGEMQAAEKLVEAARILSGQPQSLQLRYLQTLTEIAGEKSSTIVFPLPLDSLAQLLGKPRADS